MKKFFDRKIIMVIKEKEKKTTNLASEIKIDV